MNARRLFVLGMLSLGPAIILTATTEPSYSGKRAFCTYAASDIHNRRFDESAKAKKMSTACKRAKRQCNRTLNWKQKRKRFGRTHGCRKVTYGS